MSRHAPAQIDDRPSIGKKIRGVCRRFLHLFAVFRPLKRIDPNVLPVEIKERILGKLSFKNLAKYRLTSRAANGFLESQSGRYIYQEAFERYFREKLATADLTIAGQSKQERGLLDLWEFSERLPPKINSATEAYWQVAVSLYKEYFEDSVRLFNEGGASSERAPESEDFIHCELLSGERRVPAAIFDVYLESLEKLRDDRLRLRLQKSLMMRLARNPPEAQGVEDFVNKWLTYVFKNEAAQKSFLTTLVSSVRSDLFPKEEDRLHLLKVLTRWPDVRLKICDQLTSRDLSKIGRQNLKHYLLQYKDDEAVKAKIESQNAAATLRKLRRSQNAISSVSYRSRRHR